ncbi:hypothetical protein BGX31_011718 [Mortierella sp. GBA43]|nr:hypothetical protein BGX31_011718 [Mortierella sp. GBA43]
MEFTFTSTSSSTPPTGSLAPTSTSTSISTANPGGAQPEQVVFGHSPGTIDRTFVKREYGVGNTAQWRKRIISQIEDRIKDKRHSIHNSRRAGLQYDNGSTDTLPTEVHKTTAGEPPSNAPVLSEEEERRIVQEVWETFKNENLEALAQAFQGMTDREIEEIEQDILRYRYATDYDPAYDMIADMEGKEMDQSIEHYMQLESFYNAVYQQDPEMATALSLSISLLSGNPCVRCHAGAVSFTPVLSGEQPVGVASSCSGCGFSLGNEALVYIANTARNHR